jgi:hypothetical protein
LNRLQHFMLEIGRVERDGEAQSGVELVDISVRPHSLVILANTAAAK